MKRFSIIERISIRQGLITFALLSIYFIIMKALGLVHMVEFRLFNGVIMFYGCYTAVKLSKKYLQDFDFLKGYGTGLLTALLSSFLFSVFGVIYLQFINPNFIVEIQQNELLGTFQNNFIASAQIFIEGTASGFLFTHASVVLLKNNVQVVPSKITK